MDDQRDGFAKLEVRDAAEEEVEQQASGGMSAAPALIDVVPAGAVEPWFFFAAPEHRLDAGRLPGRARSIRGPPRLS